MLSCNISEDATIWLQKTMKYDIHSNAGKSIKYINIFRSLQETILF